MQKLVAGNAVNAAPKAHNKSHKHRHFVAGQFLSRAFVVLLRKNIPQNHNLKTAA